MSAAQPAETPAPDPGPAHTLDDLAERLCELKAWAGNPSYETIKKRVNTAWTAAGRPAGELTRKTTVVDCFRAGRRRVNADLVIAVVAALHPEPGYVEQWRQALRVVGGEARAASQVRAQDRLPADLPEFTGRVAELDRLRRLLRPGGVAGGPVVISALEGMAGVGKTRLAIRAGHLLAEAEPFERMFFVDLRGFGPDPAQPPADPAAVLDSFLRLMGVPGHQIPHDPAARAELYRQRLAGVRALVVLDNAADVAQVAPLLPGHPGSVAIVTSRRRLAGLHPATHLPVDVFTPDEATDFLARAVPDVPTGDDPHAAARVAERCGYLPLALGLVAGYMRARSGWTLTDHADRLDERHQARHVDDGVELAFALSYQNLPTGRRRMLRLLALHPGHDLDVYSAAALLDASLDAAREQLDHLAAEHLVLPTTPGRYAFHDLVRAYAAARAVDEDRPPNRRAALTRLFDHYLHGAAAAMDTLFPAEREHRPRVPVPALPRPAVTDPDAARTWLDTERVNLIATAGHTAAHGWPEHTSRLAAILFRYLDNGAHTGAAMTLNLAAREAAQLTGDRPAEAHALTNLGLANWRQGRYDRAADHYQRALALFRETGDRPGEARALTNLSAVYSQHGRYPQAADDANRALKLYCEIGDRLGEGRVLGSLGLIYWRLGRYEAAADHLERSVTINRELGERLGETTPLNGLGLVHERQGRYARALDYHEQALAVYREFGNRSGEAYLLSDIGVVHQRLGDHAEAAEHQRQALAIFRDLGAPGGESYALNNLGEILLGDGRPDAARAEHARALDLASGTGDRYEQARAHNGLAHCHHAGGEVDRARHHWRKALDIYTDLEIPEAGQVGEHLDRLDG